jgi:hypothetical protein
MWGVNLQLGKIHILDTPKNRSIIKNMLGPSEFDFFSDGYIQIDENTKKWRTTPAFQWLYQTPPPKLEPEPDSIFNDLINQIIEARKDYKKLHNIK